MIAEVELLALVSAQDLEDDEAGGVRIAKGVAPERIISVVDPEARHGHRSRRDRYDGYKLHVSVDVDSDLFVAGEATKATTSDAEVLPELLDADPVAVAEVIGDTHYGSVETRQSLAGQGVDLVAPAQPSSVAKGYFSKDDFTIDLDAATVTCPAGEVALIPVSSARRRQARSQPRRVAPARYANGAPNAPAVARSTSTPTRPSSSSPDSSDGRLSSATATASALRSNARTPNSKPATPSCHGEASSRPTCGSSSAWPPSTSTASAESRP